jgi:uncharacterized protein YlxW (UPF0749 family)
VDQMRADRKIQEKKGNSESHATILPITSEHVGSGGVRGEGVEIWIDSLAHRNKWFCISSEDDVLV